jgi:hypothetical protein
MPDCWLEVSLHPECPATGQLDQGFPWSQSKCKFHVALHASHAVLAMAIKKFSLNVPILILD